MYWWSGVYWWSSVGCIGGAVSVLTDRCGVYWWSGMWSGGRVVEGEKKS